MVAWQRVTPADVLRAMKDYDRLGPELPAWFCPLRSWPGKNALTRRKRSWAQLMSSPQASDSAPATSRAGRPAP
jgi:hypothetical protein